MERNYWQEPCGHRQCPDQERLEYCAEELKYSPDDIAEVVERIYALLDAKSLKSYNHRYSSEDQMSCLQRNFETESGFNNEMALAGVRHGVELHVENLRGPSRQVYNVICSWRIASDDYLTVPYSRTYTLELFSGGSVQCCVSEPDLNPAMKDGFVTYAERPMTPYDIRELYSTIDQLHQIELADPDYIDDGS